VALLVCLIPTTIGGLLSAIGVAGMSRMLGANVIATSGRAVEAAGDVDVLMLDKTGTITLGNRQATQFLPAPGVSEEQLADAAQLASLADETPEGRSIVVLAKQRFNLRERDLSSMGASFIPFSAQTRMSGVNVQDRLIRKGAVDAVRRHIEANHGRFPAEVNAQVEEVARGGGTPPWLKWGYRRPAAASPAQLCKAASRVVPDPMNRLHHISAMHRLAARRCSGSFTAIPTQDGEPRHRDSPPAGPVSSVFRRLTAVLARDQADRGQCFPEAEQSGQGKNARRHSCSHTAASSLGDCCVSDSRTGTFGSSATSSSACRRPCPTNARQGRAVVVAVLAWARLCCPASG
jgi:hypothetical protein